MRRFLKLICIFCFLYCGIILSVRAFWIYNAPSYLNRNFINHDIHTIVLGPSNGATAWNDSLIPHSRNFCEWGDSHATCYNKLRWISEYNDTQVDTIVLCASYVSFLYKPDSCLQSYVEERNSILGYKRFYDYFKYKVDYWKLVFTSFPVLNLNLKEFRGGYSYLVRERLNHPMVADGINKVLKQMREDDQDEISEQYLRDHYKYQVDFLREIGNYCRGHHKVLIILSPPIYKIPDMIDDSGYRQLIRAELGDSALIADYSRFEFPDSTYYGDLEHLNFRGARYFSKHIAKNGLELKYAINYCK